MGTRKPYKALYKERSKAEDLTELTDSVGHTNRFCTIGLYRSLNLDFSTRNVYRNTPTRLNAKPKILLSPSEKKEVRDSADQVSQANDVNCTSSRLVSIH